MRLVAAVACCVLLAGSTAWQERLPQEEELEAGGDNQTEQDYQDDYAAQWAAASPQWVNEAVRDVAYYLRSHKFNDYDRRFFTSPANVTKPLYAGFPDPPLRTLHWEVNKYCSASFLSCLHYLHEKALQAELRRAEDTVVLVLSGAVKDEQQEDEAELACQKHRRLDWVGAQPFHGHLERFQWRTTASYFMCWYTMHEVPDLAALGERCDNHASCMDSWRGPASYDPRADDRQPFLCAAYSFCPDPCCPDRHYDTLASCWAREDNPCYSDAPPESRVCSVQRSRNTDLVSIIRGMWNVSCSCLRPGFEWSSRFGLCVDVNECIRNLHSCDEKTQACFNTPGSFECICRWGFLYNKEQKQCVRNDLLMAAETGSIEKKKGSIVKKILSYIVPSAIQTDLFSEYFKNGHQSTRFPLTASLTLSLTTCKLLKYIMT
ncbi:uncharacterized protein LOC134527441 [Bacillus rossius redtenbacheri]|uniref:uncharacterized protein LOC134527441 n=1 Tax=Bacillus rossius redtenbacheri TaxID=93214 RepID=UPI002FDD8E00